MTEPSSFELVIIAGLACWRISSLLIREAGPGDMFVRVRTWASGSPALIEIFGCIWCMSVWVALLITLFVRFAWVVLLPFAISALAIGFEQLVQYRARNHEPRSP